MTAVTKILVWTWTQVKLLLKLGNVHSKSKKTSLRLAKHLNSSPPLHHFISELHHSKHLVQSLKDNKSNIFSKSLHVNQHSFPSCWADNIKPTLTTTTAALCIFPHSPIVTVTVYDLNHRVSVFRFIHWTSVSCGLRAKTELLQYSMLQTHYGRYSEYKRSDGKPRGHGYPGPPIDPNVSKMMLS